MPVSAAVSSRCAWRIFSTNDTCSVVLAAVAPSTLMPASAVASVPWATGTPALGLEPVADLAGPAVANTSAIAQAVPPAATAIGARRLTCKLVNYFLLGCVLPDAPDRTDETAQEVHIARMSISSGQVRWK